MFQVGDLFREFVVHPGLRCWCRSNWTLEIIGLAESRKNYISSQTKSGMFSQHQLPDLEALLSIPQDFFQGNDENVPVLSF